MRNRRVDQAEQLVLSLSLRHQNGAGNVYYLNHEGVLSVVHVLVYFQVDVLVVFVYVVRLAS
jgi:hypothetical protein